MHNNLQISALEAILESMEKVTIRNASPVTVLCLADFYASIKGVAAGFVQLVAREYVGAVQAGNKDAEVEAYELLCEQLEELTVTKSPNPPTPGQMEVRRVRDEKDTFQVKGWNLKVRARSAQEASARAAFVLAQPTSNLEAA